jgi:hypothetical protein
MSTQFNDTKRTLTTGDVVISVAEIFDRLQTKVDPNTLEQLLRDILAGRRSQVRPGELITAELINQILAELESLESRVTKLEAGGGGSVGTLAITDIRPAGPYKVDQQIQVMGRNFGLSTGMMRASVDKVPAIVDATNSSDQLLILRIPAIPDLPLAGRQMELMVESGSLRDSRQIQVQPFTTTQRGGLNVEFKAVDPATITPGTAAIFRYTLKSLALFPASFLITATVSEIANSSDWQNNLKILNSDQVEISDRQIRLVGEESTTFFVRVNPVPPNPAGATNVTFRLKVDVTAENVTPNADGPRLFPVGRPTPLEDPSISLSSVSADPPSALQGTNIRLAQGAFTLLTLNLNFNETGQYDLLPPVLTGATNWTATIGGLNPIPVNTAPDRQGAGFVVSAATGASASGQVEFVVQRRGATSRKSFPFTLTRL